MTLTLTSVVAAYGAKAKSKLANPVATGQPEDQLRAPFEQLLSDLAELAHKPSGTVVAVGESSVSDLKTRPDYAVTVYGVLVGFIELKSPGKGADPRKFKDAHDKAQWEKLRSLPNLIYTDGNEFSLWQNGELALTKVRLLGDIETSGSDLQSPPALLPLFEAFFDWNPIAPKTAKELAQVTARLCRLLRDEVTEQLGLDSKALTGLAKDWRKLLFPDATDERFADGYAQAVTFGMLMARAKEIKLSDGLDEVAKQLAHSNSLIGAALKLLTENAENQQTLKTSLGTLTRVLDAIDWPTVSKGDPETWLYFYEHFLEVYDNKLKKLTGSYYTPPEVVGAMVRLVDEVLISPRYGLNVGMASAAVTMADPAVGTGTFLLAILRRIAATVTKDQGEGAVKGAVSDALKRLIAFEIQLGPFAVAQLRVLAEIFDLTGSLPPTPPRMFVTDTLGDPGADEGWIPESMTRIADSRKEANKIKREEPITVVIGNPPYKEKAKGLGSWVEGQSKAAEKSAPLAAWMPPSDWGLGTHAKHLRNLYVYFWRWATWKVFDYGPGSRTGIVCFITVAGFLGGPGFQKMRQYLRQSCDDIWVIDCSPEGHQPEVNTRIFQGVQQPVCIVLASRSAKNDLDKPATVRFRALPAGHRTEKFAALADVKLEGSEWVNCPSSWRAPFLPASLGEWSTFPALEDLFIYNGSGVQPKRTWVIAPDADSLIERWQRLVGAPDDIKDDLFHATLRNGKPADRHIRSVVEGLPGFEPKPMPLIQEKGACPTPVLYGFRSFNRQWIIPDSRVITQPNALLWESRSDHQVFLTALSRTSPLTGPALTFTELPPDLDHYKGSFGGRVFPLWRDGSATASNVRPALLAFLSEHYGAAVGAEDVMAYIAAVASHPAFTARFQKDLSTPGLRIPLTSDRGLLEKAVEIGRAIVWLQSFGERMADPARGRPAGAPRLPPDRRPMIPKEGAIPVESGATPDEMSYDATKKRLRVGAGYVENVDPAVWNYEVSGKRVLLQWFSYRKKNRDHPLIGDRRPPSPLGDIQPDHWLPEYTNDLIDVLNVLTWLVDLEPAQAELLEKICAGATISAEQLRDAAALELPADAKTKPGKAASPSMFPEMG